MEYLEGLLSQYKNSLVYSFQNIKDRDISDIIRGKIMVLEELTNINKAIDEMIKLREDVKNNPPPKPGSDHVPVLVNEGRAF